MSDRTHTPAPWVMSDPLSLDRGRVNGPVFAIHGPGWYDLALVYQDAKETPADMRRGFANARLIAAAPDLLAALKEIRKNAANLLDDGLPHLTARDFAGAALTVCDAAIARATGGVK